MITYQGDGDLAAIGTAEIIHAANRGENITVIFVNNAHLWHDRRPDGADHAAGQEDHHHARSAASARNEGYPLHVCELLATLEAPVFIERVALGSNKQIMASRRG